MIEKVFSLEEAYQKWPPGKLTKRMKNYQGEHGNKCTPIYFSKRENKRTYGIFKCDCGSFFEARIDQVKLGLVSSKGTKSCGCMHKEKAKIQQQKLAKNNICDITGQQSGTGTAIKRLEEKNSSGSYYGLCKCEQGHFNKISQGNGGKTKTCRQCKEHYSLGELAIQKFLKQLNISFKEEYSFDNCKYKNKLRFDFYLPDYNCCIEYDGIQHFKQTNFSHDDLEIRQLRDNIKNKYCQDNNIALIRIPYTDIELINEQYLIDKFKEYDIIIEQN